MKKRILSLLLAVVLLIGMMPWIAIEAAAATTYVIGNGVSVPSSNVPADGTNKYCNCGLTVGTGKHGCCWNYGYNVYYHVWGVYPNRYTTSTQYLRNLSAADKTLTASHLKSYLENAAPGALVRLDVHSEAATSDSDGGHTLVFVQMNSTGDGAFFLEGNYDGHGKTRLAEWKFSSLASQFASRYPYIKYISWPDAPAYTSCNHVGYYKDCGVCSKCGHIFDWESTFSAATMGTYRISKAGTPRTDKPYDAATKATYELVAGSDITVLGSYVNAYGSTWYKFMLEGGETAYIYEDYLSFKDYLKLKVTCSGFTPENAAVLSPKAYPVQGTVTSNYPLKSIDAYLNGEYYASWTASNQSTTSVSLRNTDINYDLDFGSLSDGQYVITLKAKDFANPTAVSFYSSTFTIQSEASNTPTILDLSCASFISNAEHREYIDMMMRHYISSNSELAATLDNGKSVVFMFEGGSDNYPSNTYSPSGSNVRNQAVVIVVQKKDGEYKIVFYSEDCSSIPSQPEDTSGGAYDRQTTILDGIYKIQTCNHQGKYGALNVITSTGYYTPSSNKDGWTNYASGINIHTRSTQTAGSGDGAWSWGCQLVGSGGSSSNAFNSFMKVVAGISYNVWTKYSSDLDTIIAGKDVGYYVVDRQLAVDGLKALYTKTALDNITKTSREAYEQATAPLVPQYRITFDANGGTLPDAFATHKLNGINVDRLEGYMVVYNTSGKLIKTNEYGVEILVDAHHQAIGIRDFRSEVQQTVPNGGFILSGHESNGVGTWLRTIKLGYYLAYDEDSMQVFAYDTQNAFLAHHKMVEEGQQIGALPVPSREGYTFDGWYTTPVNGYKITGEDFVGSDITLYAYWKSDSCNDGHTLTGTVVTAPTMNSEGLLHCVCTYCDYWVEMTMPAFNTTDYEYGVIIEPTCTQSGLGVYGWLNYNYGLFTFDVTINPLGHVYSYQVTNEPTITSTGMLTGTCIGCGDTDLIVLPVLNTTDYVYHILTEATCTKEGKACYVWNNIDYASVIVNVTTPTAPHVYESLHSSATCVNYAKTVYTCIYCEYSYTEIHTEAGLAEHKYVEKVVPPTCVDSGYTSHTCSKCGDKYTDNTVPATGHAYTPQIVQIPTETQIGSMKAVCGNCNHSVNCTLPMLDNANYSYEVIREPDVGQAGLGRYTWIQVEYGLVTIDVVIPALPAPSEPDPEPDPVSDYTYTVTDGKATITAANVSGDVVIPDTLDGYPVVAISNNAFENNTALTSVVIPSSVTSIGAYAFSGCSALKEVEIPDSVTYLGDYAFNKCIGLESAIIGNGLTYIRSWVFKGCSSLKSIHIGDGVTGIGTQAFLNCSTLQVITGNVCLKNIYGGAFRGCTSLTSIELPSTLVRVYDSAFYDCENLKDVYYSGSEAEWSAVTIGYENAPLQNATIHYNYTSGEEPILYGDVNGDGNVNTKDRMVLTRYLAGMTGYTADMIDMKAADVNCDGTVNAKDRMILTRYLAQWTAYPALPHLS